jgi:hypothetical protein
MQTGNTKNIQTVSPSDEQFSYFDHGSPIYPLTYNYMYPQEPQHNTVVKPQLPIQVVEFGNTQTGVCSYTHDDIYAAKRVGFYNGSLLAIIPTVCMIVWWYIGC